MTTETEENHGLQQAKAQLASICELVENLQHAREDDVDLDEAERAIHEDALSVEVRGDWHLPDDGDGSEPTEYRILLCTGGPAVQITGELEDCQPKTAELQHQDWFKPWTRFAVSQDEESALLEYARCFYFGE